MAKKLIGSVNATTMASVWSGETLLGHCLCTPNAIAYAFLHLGGDRAVSAMLGTTTRVQMESERIAAGGWLKSDEEAFLTRA